MEQPAVPAPLPCFLPALPPFLFLAGCPVKRYRRPQTSCLTVALGGSCPGRRVKAECFLSGQVPEALL